MLPSGFWLVDADVAATIRIQHMASLAQFHNSIRHNVVFQTFQMMQSI